MTDYPNWFAQTAQRNFEQFLLPEAGKFGLTYLQLGAYTGDASVWLCENVLTGDQSRLFDVDTWAGSDEPAHESIDFDDVYNYYLSRVIKRQVRDYRQTSTSYLAHELYCCDEFHLLQYDFIYIDADHTTVGVILDAELSWPLLKSGGIMAFDDYTWGHESGDPRLAPMVGIDLFLHRHQGDYELLAKNDQVWIKKTA
jgi:hypothetical protein